MVEYDTKTRKRIYTDHMGKVLSVGDKASYTDSYGYLSDVEIVGFKGTMVKVKKIGSGGYTFYCETVNLYKRVG